MHKLLYKPLVLLTAITQLHLISVSTLSLATYFDATTLFQVLALLDMHKYTTANACWIQLKNH